MTFFSPRFLFHHFSSFLTKLLYFKVVAILFFEVVCVPVDSELESNVFHLLFHLHVSNLQYHDDDDDIFHFSNILFDFISLN